MKYILMVVLLAQFAMAADTRVFVKYCVHHVK